MPPARKRKLDELHEVCLENLVCPITQELPYDPVIAADGFMYERFAILKWFANHTRSPTTNLELDTTRVTRVPSIKALVRSLVASGHVKDRCMITLWLKNERQRNHVETVRRRADNGDVKAIMTLAGAYRDGLGVELNLEEAFRWFERACKLGDPLGTCATGQALCEGHGVYKNYVRGMLLIGNAAGLGVGHAFFLLGHCHRFGMWGISRNYEEARRYYNMATQAPVQATSSKEDVEEALRWANDDS